MWESVDMLVDTTMGKPPNWAKDFVRFCEGFCIATWLDDAKSVGMYLGSGFLSFVQITEQVHLSPLRRKAALRRWEEQIVVPQVRRKERSGFVLVCYSCAMRMRSYERYSAQGAAVRSAGPVGTLGQSHVEIL